MESLHQPVLYYDGVCNLCSRSVQFILRNDKKELFRFAPLQSEKGREAILLFPGSPPDSLILFYKGRYFIRSEAALRILKLLGGFWSLLFGFIIIPRFLRDAVYDLIARNRYKWFGKNKECLLPPGAND